MLDNERVVRLAEEHEENPGVIIAARSITDLADFRRLSPGLRTLGLVPGPKSGPPDPAAIEEFAQAGADIIRLWPQWIIARSQDATPGQSLLVQRLHDLGKPAWATADTLYGDISPEHPREDLTELVRLGTDGIITNLPELLQDVARQQPSDSPEAPSATPRHSTTRRARITDKTTPGNIAGPTSMANARPALCHLKGPPSSEARQRAEMPVHRTRRAPRT